MKVTDTHCFGRVSSKTPTSLLGNMTVLFFILVVSEVNWLANLISNSKTN